MIVKELLFKWLELIKWDKNSKRQGRGVVTRHKKKMHSTIFYTKFAQNDYSNRKPVKKRVFDLKKKQPFIQMAQINKMD